jgi:hypothetical protein
MTHRSAADATGIGTPDVNKVTACSYVFMSVTPEHVRTVVSKKGHHEAARKWRSKDATSWLQFCSRLINFPGGQQNDPRDVAAACPCS